MVQSELRPLVTVIVPVYNVEKYLPECTRSLINQTYQRIEIILVDDGSTDRSGKICDEVAQTDRRIRVVHKENAGLGYARNSGLDIASGKYVTFVDSDDIPGYNMVKNLINGLEENQADTCIGGFGRIDAEGNQIAREKYEKTLYCGKAVYHDLFGRLLGSPPDAYDAVKSSVWNVLYSMDIIRRHHLRFVSERVYISEDVVWNCDYYQYAQRVQIIDSASYLYRITPQSLTQRYYSDRLDKCCTLYNKVLDQVNGNSNHVLRLQRQFFINLRGCIHQECRSISGHGAKMQKERIGALVHNETVCQVLGTYPIKKIQWRQKIFLKLLKHKMVFMLQLLTEMSII